MVYCDKCEGPANITEMSTQDDFGDSSEDILESIKMDIGDSILADGCIITMGQRTFKYSLSNDILVLQQ